MKKITDKTILKQGDKIFYPEQFSQGIYWRDKDGEYITDKKYVAQSTLMVKNLPIISLDSYSDKLKKGLSEFSKISLETKESFWIGKAAGFGEALQIYNSNQNTWTDQDIVRAVNLARKGKIKQAWEHYVDYDYSIEEILKQINSISVIEVDEQFNIINYE
jgi:hypothetical protein